MSLQDVIKNRRGPWQVVITCSDEFFLMEDVMPKINNFVYQHKTCLMRDNPQLYKPWCRVIGWKPVKKGNEFAIQLKYVGSIEMMKFIERLANDLLKEGRDQDTIVFAGPHDGFDNDYRNTAYGYNDEDGEEDFGDDDGDDDW